MIKSSFSVDFSALSQQLPEGPQEYGRFQQHLALLEDRWRLEVFHRAITYIPPGSVALDVGAGTGILALMALKHGYEHAILIEPSRKMASYAAHLLAENGFENRVTIIQSDLERVAPSKLPRLDLIVTETLSSLLFGFGTWDALPRMIERLRNPSRIIPFSGQLFALPVSKDLNTKGYKGGGLAFLDELGIDIDLDKSAFRSGGNVFYKNVALDEIKSSPHMPTCIAGFEFGCQTEIVFDGGVLSAAEDVTVTGILTYWKIQLNEEPDGISFTNLDPRLTSWCPYYIPLNAPIHLTAGQQLPISLRLLPIDVPYTYAFQFFSKKRPITNVLYW